VEEAARTGQESAFLPAFGNRPARLVGRDPVVSGFVEGLEHPTGHPGRATLLVGQRGMGKTALLLEFAQAAEERGFIAARATAGGEMLGDLIGTIQSKGTRFVKTGRKLAGASAGVLGFSAGLTFTSQAEAQLSFLNKLIVLSEALEKHGRGLVFLIDEVQASTPAMRTLTTSYQHLVGEGRNVAVAMAGLPHAVSSVLNDDLLTFLNRARKVPLGPLPLGEISLHYATVLRDGGKSISPSVLEGAVEATRGYPYLLQLVGYYLVRYSAGSAKITQSMVSQAATSARRDLVDAIHEPVLRPLSRQDLEFLRQMARDEGSSRIADIQARMGASASTAQAYRRRLINAGVLAPGRRGELDFAVPYLAEYLRGDL
jgi:hypothetical protein